MSLKTPSNDSIMTFLQSPRPHHDPTANYDASSAHREASNLVNSFYCTLYAYAMLVSPSFLPPAISSTSVSHDLDDNGQAKLLKDWTNRGIKYLIPVLKSLESMIGRSTPPRYDEFLDVGVKLNPNYPFPRTGDKAWTIYYLHITRGVYMFQKQWEARTKQFPPSKLRTASFNGIVFYLKTQEYDYKFMIETMQSLFAGSPPPLFPSEVAQSTPMTPAETPAGPVKTRVRRDHEAPRGGRQITAKSDPLVSLAETDGTLIGPTLGIEVEGASTVPDIPADSQSDGSDYEGSPQRPLRSDISVDDGDSSGEEYLDDDTMEWTLSGDGPIQAAVPSIIVTAPTPPQLPRRELELDPDVCVAAASIDASVIRKNLVEEDENVDGGAEDEADSDGDEEDPEEDQKDSDDKDEAATDQAEDEGPEDGHEHEDAGSTEAGTTNQMDMVDERTLSVLAVEEHQVHRSPTQRALPKSFFKKLPHPARPPPGASSPPIPHTAPLSHLNTLPPHPLAPRRAALDRETSPRSFNSSRPSSGRADLELGSKTLFRQPVSSRACCCVRTRHRLCSCADAEETSSILSDVSTRGSEALMTPPPSPPRRSPHSDSKRFTDSFIRSAGKAFQSGHYKQITIVDSRGHIVVDYRRLAPTPYP